MFQELDNWSLNSINQYEDVECQNYNNIEITKNVDKECYSCNLEIVNLTNYVEKEKSNLSLETINKMKNKRRKKSKKA